MIRFIMHLFGKVYEPCKTCEVLREQLEHERAIQREMFAAFNDLVKPNRAPEVQNTITGMVPAARPFILPSKIKSELERVDRERARVEKTSIHLAIPDDKPKPTVSKEALNDINKLEAELGLDGENEDASRISNSNG